MSGTISDSGPKRGQVHLEAFESQRAGRCAGQAPANRLVLAAANAWKGRLKLHVQHLARSDIGCCDENRTKGSGSFNRESCTLLPVSREEKKVSKASSGKPHGAGAGQETRPEASGRSSARANDERPAWRSIILTAILTAVLTACTTSLGIYVTSRYQLRQWHNEKMYTIEADLLSRRFGIVERFIKIANHESDLSSLYALRQQDLKDMQNAVSKGDLVKVIQFMRQNSEDNHRFDELNSEYLAVITMAVELFGPKTQKAVAVILKNHNPEVWEASEREKSDVVAAMSGELLLNLGDVPADTKVTASVGPNGSTRTAH